MNSFKLITYDLCKFTKNYDKLYQYLQGYWSYARVTESCWVIPTEKSCSVIRAELSKILDTDDRIFVTEFLGDYDGQNTLCKLSGLKDVL